MMSVDVLLSYAALGYCAYKLVSAAAVATSGASHRFPSVPRGVRPAPGHVDVLRWFFVTSGGLALYVRKWLPRFDRAPRGVFFIMHGLGGHGGRYDHVGRALAREGFAVFTVDHQGHGRSDGERMYATEVLDLSKDFMEFVQHVLNGPQPGSKNAAVVDEDLEAHAHVKWKELPRFVLGHSMGGVLVLQLVGLSVEQGLSWNGVIVSSAPFWAVPGGGVAGFLGFLARMLPRLQLPGFEFPKLGNDFEVYKRWSRDELMPKHGSTLRLMYSLLKEGDRFGQSDNELVKSFPAPLYVLHGEKDTITFPQGSVNFYTACTQKDKTINVVPNAVHEVLNLEGYDKVLNNILEWMVARLE
ncbi:hypothetical protein PR003_g16362 [Phytophthora rubi]|uniref:Serine aminopeptidase S33 domain-containing protein n=1 Tax=Phytophthora rubi TaxID=129364 RepID=A0A6A3L921_9STRA|nr:hypothetical protein PR002_g16038 [Phytophthora rubi]KAE9016046.1 hypothetical protein PR001_g14751 [Phytophthora rubi]KAE9325892.1 hypothetical protein PR003_g16362 [Phytophthora rubi]